MTNLKSLLYVSTAIALGASPTFAQDEGTSSIFAEEIFVTAQKRSENIQDVGISITAFSGNQLQALGYTNAQQVTALAPGVSTIQPNGEANYSIAIRGVANSDFTTNVESPIAIYVDDVYISQTSGAGFLLFDMERVEILRGPQGTLFGRNATGGLVSYQTVKPNAEEFEGFFNVQYGSFERIRLQGAANMPVTDELSVRISAMTHQGGGYVTNRLDPSNDLNNANETAGRVQVFWEPTDTFDLLLNARFGEQDIRTGFFEFASAINPDGQLTPGVPIPELGGYVDNDGDVFAGDYDRTGFNKLDTWGTSATMNWDVGFGTITSISDFQSVKRNYIEDSDASPANYFNFFLTTDSQQFSQELRVAGESGPLKWVGGFYYLDLNIDDSNGAITTELFDLLASVGAFDDPEGNGPRSVEEFGANGLVNPYTIDRSSWSLFGQVDYALTDQLTLIGGFRYISEDTDFTYRNIFSVFGDINDGSEIQSGLDPRIMPAFDGLDPLDESRSDSEWAARIQLNYQANDDLLLYASWNRGVKSGGYNAPLLPTAQLLADGNTATLPGGEVIPVSFVTYEPEKLDAFEAGFKWDVMPGLLRVNGSAYYYDYKNAQVFSIIGLDTFTVNADSEVKGFELEMTATPIDGLDINFGVGFIDAEIDNVPGLSLDVDVPALGDTISALLPGATVSPVQTPKWNLSGLIRYEFPIGPGNIALQTDMQYRSEHAFALTGLPAVTQDGYFLANASITYLPEDAPWDIRFFVENLTDEEYLVQTFDLSGSVFNGGLFGLVEQYYGRPRMWGVQANFNF